MCHHKKRTNFGDELTSQAENYQMLMDKYKQLEKSNQMLSPSNKGNKCWVSITKCKPFSTCNKLSALDHNLPLLTLHNMMEIRMRMKIMIMMIMSSKIDS